MATQKERLEAELQLIKKNKGGLLMPEDVVEFARNKESALHSQFTWDDSEAARKYRLVEARVVIRVHVLQLNSGDKIPEYVSLMEDRANGGGYREMKEVLADPALTQKLLKQAMQELRAMQQRYQRLEALRPLWKAVDVIEEEVKTPAE